MTVSAPESQTVSTRTVPWTKIGPLVDTPMTAKEAAQLGGLNFTVSKRPLFFGEDENATTGTEKIGERAAVVRDDTNQWLGVMSKSYPLIQYSEAFDFMDTVGGVTYHAAGALKKGKQGFIVAQLPDIAAEVLKHRCFSCCAPATTARAPSRS
jgi:hypothetical protein